MVAFHSSVLYDEYYMLVLYDDNCHARTEIKLIFCGLVIRFHFLHTNFCSHVSTKAAPKPLSSAKQYQSVTYPASDTAIQIRT